MVGLTIEAIRDKSWEHLDCYRKIMVNWIGTEFEIVTGHLLTPQRKSVTWITYKKHDLLSPNPHFVYGLSGMIWKQRHDEKLSRRSALYVIFVLHSIIFLCLMILQSYLLCAKYVNIHDYFISYFVIYPDFLPKYSF